MINISLSLSMSICKIDIFLLIVFHLLFVLPIDWDDIIINKEEDNNKYKLKLFF
jgi:hypothetical protein